MKGSTFLALFLILAGATLIVVAARGRVGAIRQAISK